VQGFNAVNKLAHYFEQTPRFPAGQGVYKILFFHVGLSKSGYQGYKKAVFQEAFLRQADSFFNYYHKLVHIRNSGLRRMSKKTGPFLFWIA
jgi:hypothetical protein